MSTYLLKESNKSYLSYVLDKYINKYIYIYKNINPNYTNISFTQKNKIRDIAILNLYLIYQINKINGLYFLLIYLYS